MSEKTSSDHHTLDNPAYTKDDQMQRLWHLYLRHASAAVERLLMHRTLGVSVWDGVDQVRADARRLFAQIPAEALMLPDDAKEQDVFVRALRVCMHLMFAASDDREDLYHRYGWALQTGLFAVNERMRGFNEPFLRAQSRSRKQSRETLYTMKVKAISATAFEALKRFGFEDAANQVAEVINRSRCLPLKRNGKAVVARSVLNWHARLRSGDLNFTWLCEKEGMLFPKAHVLWRAGQPEAARRRVLRFLPKYIEAERRAIQGN
jgi:hypothetical protein